MSQKPLQIFFSENPLKKRNILQNSFNNNAPIIEQKLIIHHKRNLRKSLLHNSKQDFDKEQKQKDMNLPFDALSLAPVLHIVHPETVKYHPPLKFSDFRGKEE